MAERHPSPLWSSPNKTNHAGAVPDASVSRPRYAHTDGSRGVFLVVVGIPRGSVVAGHFKK